MTNEDFTPDTASVRRDYIQLPDNPDWEAVRAGWFDRWLRAERAQVWEEGWSDATNDKWGTPEENGVENPYQEEAK